MTFQVRGPGLGQPSVDGMMPRELGRVTGVALPKDARGWGQVLHCTESGARGTLFMAGAAMPFGRISTTSWVENANARVGYIVGYRSARVCPTDFLRRRSQDAQECKT